jgi:hypothetical protein
VVGLGLAERLLSERVPFVQAWLGLHAPDPALYFAFTETLVQTVGAFLGLYLAALSVVVSTAYARVPADVRSLLITEPSSGVFLRSLAFTTGAAFAVLAAQAIKWNPGTASFWLLVFLGFVSVFGVVQLGLGVLTLFDPAAHTHRLVRTVWKAADSATKRGFRSKDISFQAAYQREAENALSTYKRLVDVALGEGPADRSSLIAMTRTALGMLRVYLDSKPDIPHDSRWFKRVGRHPSWFRASHARVEMAERTGTLLQPELVGDEFWLEAAVIGIVTQVSETLATWGDCEGIAQIALAAEKVVEDLAKNLRFEDALRVHRAFVPLAKRVARLEFEASGAGDKDLYRLGAIDALFRNLTAVLVASGQAVSALTPEWVRALARRIRQHPERPIPGAALPHAVHKETVTLRRCLGFERTVEGGTVTSLWFCEHVIGAGYVEAFADLVTALLDEAEGVFPQEVFALTADKRATPAVLIAQIALEWCERFEFQFRRMARAEKDLSELEHRQAADPWAALDEQEVALRMERLHDQLLQALAQAAQLLPPTPSSDEYPDLFGYAYGTLGRECYTALAGGKPALFRSLFPQFFLLALRAYERVGKELHKFPQETQLVIAADVLSELTEISGYALVWSELDGGDAWQVVRSTWDGYLNARPDVKSTAEFIIGMLDLRESIFRMSTSDIRRTSWHQDFERRMQARGLGGGLLRQETIRAEPTSLVARTFLRHGIMSGSAAVAFLAEYLLQRPEAAGLTPTRQMQQWIDALDIESRRVSERRPPPGDLFL